MRLAFAVPGDLLAQTGGYRYAREVMARLPAFGVDPVPCRLPGSFPHPSLGDVDEAVFAMRAALASSDGLMVDGLAFGALPQEAVARIGESIIALCHHPLALETGLSVERSAELLASEKAALALAARIIVSSPHTAMMLARDFAVPAEKIAVAPPGCERVLRAQGSGGPQVGLLALGTLTPRKAFDVLILALAGLKDLPWRLRLVGGARYAPQTAAQIERLIVEHGLSDRVELPGELTGQALERVFLTSDVFVSSSLYEGYGMALAEALAHGLPIVAAAGGAAAHTVPDGAGLKVPPGDVEALRAALRRVIGDDALRAQLAEAAFRAGQSLPTWADTAGIIAGVVRELARP